MRWAWMVLLMALAGRIAAAQTVEGTVFNDFTGRPVAGAKVALQQSGLAVYYAFTDAEGQFRIEDVKAGTYTPQYSASGYGVVFGPKLNSPIQVTAGATVKLEGFLTPTGQIFGRVVDGRGNPVEGARVEIAAVSGTAQIFTDIHTDANGKFRVPARPDLGEMILVATPPADWKPPDLDPQSKGKEPRAWARTYYPSTPLRNLAAPLAVPSSGELDGIEIKLRAVPLRAIRGILFDPDGHPAPKVEIGLWDPRQSGPAAFTAETKADGSFEISQVPEGEWRAIAEPQVNGVTLRAAEWIVLQARDADGLNLRLSPPIAVGGRVIFEKREGAAAPKAPLFFLSEQRAGHAFPAGTRRTAEADEDGDFQFHNFYPGTYSISTGEAPSGFYLDSIRLGGAPVTGEIELSATSPELNVVYKRDGGTVRGTVENCHSNLVVLVPRDASGMPDFAGNCGTDGRFEISAVRPGDYFAVAIPGLRLWGSSVDPNLLRSASLLTVRAGETTQADLRIAPAR